MTKLGWKLMGLTVILLVGTLAGAQVTTENLVGSWNVAPADSALAAPTLASANSGDLYGPGVVYGWDLAMGPVLQFNGIPGYLAAPYADGFEPPTGTLEVWVNPAPDQNADLADKASGGRFVYGLAILKAGRAKAVIGAVDRKGNYVFISAVTPVRRVTPNQWHQLVMRWGGGMLALFVDGQLLTVKTYREVPGKGLNYADDRQPFYIGTQGDWGGVVYGPYNGMIGVTRLYSVALSETQILNNFLATKPQ